MAFMPGLVLNNNSLKEKLNYRGELAKSLNNLMINTLSNNAACSTYTCLLPPHLKAKLPNASIEFLQ